MQSGSGDSDVCFSLLALNVMIEAARAGEAGRAFAELPDKLLKKAQHRDSDCFTIRDAAMPTGSVDVLTSRITATARRQALLERCAQAIGEQAASSIGALAQLDAQAGILACDPAQADALRATVTAIENRRQDLERALAADRDRLAYMLESCVEGIGQRQQDDLGTQKSGKNENRLDPGDGEMF